MNFQSHVQIVGNVTLSSSFPFTNIPLKILTLNIFIRPPGIVNHGNDWKTDRLKWLTQCHDFHTYDIASFQELFGSFSRRRHRFLHQCLKRGHYKYCITSPSPSSFYRIDSGLTILSKYKIIQGDFFPFSKGSNVDWFCEKGVLYAFIYLFESSNIGIHVFNTHLQSSYSYEENSKSYMIRKSQIDELARFVEHKTKADFFPCVIMGDFNINSRTNPNQDGQFQSKEMQHLIQVLTNMRTKFPIHIQIDSQSIMKNQHNQCTFSKFFCKSKISKSKFLDQVEPSIDVIFKVFNMIHHFNGEYPITYGDVLVDADGKERPNETQLTDLISQGSKKCLDYIFWCTRIINNAKLASFSSYQLDVTSPFLDPFPIMKNGVRSMQDSTVGMPVFQETHSLFNFQSTKINAYTEFPLTEEKSEKLENPTCDQDDSMDLILEKQNLIIITPIGCETVPFLFKPNVHPILTQVSDHYGVEASFKIEYHPSS